MRYKLTYRQITLLWNGFCLGLGGLFVAALFLPAIDAARSHSELLKISRALQALPKDRIVSAIESFRIEQKARGGSIPESIALDSLIAGGYLPEELVRNFPWRAETLVAMTAIIEKQQGDLLRVRSKWGWMILRADGRTDRRDGKLEGGRLTEPMRIPAPVGTSMRL